MATADVQGIYLIRCLVNERVYVGSSKRIGRRFDDHRRALRKGSHHSPLLQRAWLKYGESAFALSVIEVVADESQLFAREQVYLDALSAAVPENGYNICADARGPRGVRRTPEQKEANRKHMLALPDLADRVERMAAANRGRKLGPRPLEVREKIAASHQGRPLSEAHRARLSEAKQGIVLSPSHRERMKAGLRHYFDTRPRKESPLPKRFRMDAEVLRAGIILYNRGATTAELVPVLGFTADGWGRALRRAGVAMGRRGSHPGVPRPTHRNRQSAARVA